MNPHPSLRTARTSGSAGYSLIEILTVIGLIGILVTLVAPHIDVTYYRMNAATQTVGSTLLAAQRSAVQEQHNVIFALDPEGARYRIHQDADNDLQMDAGESVVIDSLGTGVRIGLGGAPSKFGSGEAFDLPFEQGGWPAVIYYRNGTANAEGGFHMTSVRAIRSRGHSGDTRAVQIERSTGRPTWFNYTATAWKQGF